MESPRNTTSISPLDATIWLRFRRRRSSRHAPLPESAVPKRVSGRTVSGSPASAFSAAVFTFENRFPGHGSLPSESAYAMYGFTSSYQISYPCGPGCRRSFMIHPVSPFVSRNLSEKSHQNTVLPSQNLRTSRFTTSLRRRYGSFSLAPRGKIAVSTTFAFGCFARIFRRISRMARTVSTGGLSANRLKCPASFVPIMRRTHFAS